MTLRIQVQDKESTLTQLSGTAVAGSTAQCRVTLPLALTNLSIANRDARLKATLLLCYNTKTIIVLD